MQSVDLAHIREVLSKLVSLRCVQAWIGHGSVLFLGLGDTIIAPTIDQRSGRKRHGIPPYELTTCIAEWQITDPNGNVFSSEDGETRAHISPALIGRRVTRIRVFPPSMRLEVELDEVVTLSIVPAAPYDNDECYSWGITVPNRVSKWAIIGNGFREINQNEPLYPRQTAPPTAHCDSEKST